MSADVDRAIAKIRAIIAAAKIVLKDVDFEELSEDEAENIVALYDVWAPDTTYSPGDIVSYDDKLYKVNDAQGHTSQDGWEPPNVPALFSPVRVTSGDDDEIDDFVQPTGQHDSYQTGDKVKFNGQIYRSLIDNNVYSPSDYPAGWELVV